MKTFVYFIIFLLFYCIPFKGVTQQIIKVVPEKKNPILLSTLAESVTPIRLKSDKILVGEVREVTWDDKNIFLTDTQNDAVFRFDMQGNFLNTLGTKGHGPKEYLYPGGFCIDPERKELYLLTTDKGLFCFDYSGKLKQIYKHVKGREIRLLKGQFYLNQPNAKRSASNVSAKREIIIYNRNLEETIRILVRSFQSKPNLNILKGAGIEYTFFSIKDNIFIYQPEFIGRLDIMRDTIYQLIGNRLKPDMRLDFGKTQLDSKGRTEVIIRSVYRTNRFVFCFYKRDRNPQSSIFCYDLQQGVGMTTQDGFKDDIRDTGIFKLLCPTDTDKHLFYFTKNAYELVGKIDGITEEDNPVVFLVQLKK